ncbi:MAG: tRNA (N6-isopentenyl adenosine(37)-C2)-methylthiotransferase MiaB [Ignavibacteria bacterium]|jgi:tRNA-2-methylthio-N6-dimethylallyladenosine synthase|nr:tRNA (N6-isopentenyl adenosine(37)-C2)-methylthiotransferase MiaB [Ignavibacteria bacterium]
MLEHQLYIETYGCQMNLNDTEIVQKIMTDAGCLIANNIAAADIILLNTCSVRDNAEEKIHNRIETLYHLLKKRKKTTVLGILGCMAERLQSNLLESNNIVSLVVGPDEYRKLPELISLAFKGEKHIAVDMTSIETYDDVIPLCSNGISAWISIMRGCNNFCSYCIVPYTRGRERSRPADTIINEVKSLVDRGVKEITLLGQNVNSYSYESTKFHTLLADAAEAVPKNVRIAFLTSHPMDLSDSLIDTIAQHDNICKYIHLPIQSGSNRILKLMNRKYSLEHYLDIISKIKRSIPNVSISTDVIAGYPSETIEDHQQTLAVIKEVRYVSAFMFRYSPREGTKSYKENDSVPEEEKIRRLNEIIQLQNRISGELNQQDIGKTFEVLVETPSKKNPSEWVGKTMYGKSVIFGNTDGKYIQGDYANVIITDATSATLKGNVVE